MQITIQLRQTLKFFLSTVHYLRSLKQCAFIQVLPPYYLVCKNGLSSRRRRSAYSEKQQNPSVDPSMLRLFPVFVCLSHFSISYLILASVYLLNPPKKPVTFGVYG
ncbi:hypothetical protein V6N13_020697 [Hibiscus sabdariffa]